jgi:ribonuclease D
MSTRIVKDFGNGHYIVAFGEDRVYTTLTSSGDVVTGWLDLIYRIHRRRLDTLVVGLDVEWRPAQSRGAAPGPVALLQICVGRRCLVFQILRADYVPDSLFDFFADERLTFVGVGVGADAQKLSAHYGLEVANTVDLRYFAADVLGKPALRRAGLQGVVWQVMGVWPEKPHHVQVSAWDAQRLTLEQLQYACADAFASFEVGRRLYDGVY